MSAMLEEADRIMRQYEAWKKRYPFKWGDTLSPEDTIKALYSTIERGDWAVDCKEEKLRDIAENHYRYLKNGFRDIISICEGAGDRENTIGDAYSGIANIEKAARDMLKNA